MAGQASIGTVSCASSTNCGAGGSYTSGFTSTAPIIQAFVANKTANIWRQAEEVPGTAALNTGGNAKINSVSCPAPGDCSAGGYYTDASSGHQQALVVTETGGTWGTAKEVPGSAALNAGGPGAVILSVSCAAPGDCSAGGYYSDAAGHEQALVVTQTGGTWGTAKEVPGIGALNAGGSARVDSLSCGAAGDCSAGGQYASKTVDGISTVQAFVVSETGGTWGKAAEVPGTAALNGGGYATVNSVSCPSAGNCSAGGSYTTAPRSPRRSSSTRPAEPGGRHEWSPAAQLSTSAGSPRSTRCRAPRRATAAPAGSTWTPPSTPRRSW